MCLLKATLVAFKLNSSTVGLQKRHKLHVCVKLCNLFRANSNVGLFLYRSLATYSLPNMFLQLQHFYYISIVEIPNQKGEYS